VITDQMLEDLTTDERADVVRRIHLMAAAELPVTPRVLVARRWFPRFLAGCCLALIPWTIGLAMTLPQHYVARHWDAQWTGFDVLLFGGLSLTAWSVWRRRQIVVPATLVTSTLLLCDAWFDVLTSDGRDLWISVAAAVFIELPLATLLGLMCLRLIKDTVRVTRGLPHDAPIPPLWRAPLVTVVDSIG
jgi:hypothetical protein